MQQEIRNSKHYKFLNGLVLVNGNVLLYKINIVLKDYDMIELNNLDRGEMLGCLWLRTAFICSDEKQCTVHDGCSVEHSRHENIVSLNNRTRIDHQTRIKPRVEKSNTSTSTLAL